MRRHLLTAALTLAFGLVMMAADASACCHKKKACAPAPVCQPVCEPCPPPAPVCEPCPPPKKHCGGHKLFARRGCHKRQAECVVVYAAPAAPCPSGQCGY